MNREPVVIARGVLVSLTDSQCVVVDSLSFDTHTYTSPGGAPVPKVELGARVRVEGYVIGHGCTAFRPVKEGDPDAASMDILRRWLAQQAPSAINVFLPKVVFHLPEPRRDVAVSWPLPRWVVKAAELCLPTAYVHWNTEAADHYPNTGILAGTPVTVVVCGDGSTTLRFYDPQTLDIEETLPKMLNFQTSKITEIP